MSQDLLGGETCGFALTPEAEPHVENAAINYYSDVPAAEKSLHDAIAASPECLGAYFSLYKFYFYKRRLQDAERAASNALAEAARQGGFDPDWTKLSNESADWGKTESPQHFYLFTLKAMAFIRLRQEQGDSAMAILSKLFELDPNDSVGASVIQQLAFTSLNKEQAVPEKQLAL